MGTIVYPSRECLHDLFNIDVISSDYHGEGAYTLNTTENGMDRLMESCADQQNDRIYSGPMVWIGIYIAIASAFCILAMVADLFHGFRNRKLWFPCTYFSLNAASITVITVAMKLPVDLNSEMPGDVDQATKLGSMAFMCIMMANLMPSLASMDNKTLLANVIGLAILIITMIVNIFIQINTLIIATWFFDKGTSNINIFRFNTWAYVYMGLMLLLLVILISSAITIPTSKQILEVKYQAASKPTSTDQHIRKAKVKELETYVRRYWIVAESGSPQFLMASNLLSNASGIICLITLVTHLVFVLNTYISYLNYRPGKWQSTYKWSIPVIFITQSIGVVVGSIAPIFRCFTVLRFKFHLENHLLVFKIEKYWTQMLCGWKESRLPFLCSAHRSRVFVHTLKNLFLSLLIGFQNVVVVSCKVIGLIRIVLLIIAVCCSYCWKSLKALLFTTPTTSSSDDTNDDLRKYVLQIEDEMEFADMAMKGISNSMNRLMKKVKKEQYNDLLELLGKSTGFEGVEKFDNDQVRSLLSTEPVNSWSLSLVTLTCIAVALSNICEDKVKRLFKGVGDGILFTHLVEESLNNASEYVKVRKATMNLWHEVEDNYKWLGNALDGNAYKGKTSAEVLKWFVDNARKMVIEIKERAHGELMESLPNKLIVANSMYRIAESLLLNYPNIEAITKKQLFELLSCMISDILSAALTNIPQAIVTKCHESVIEKREASVHAAAKLLGRTTEIIRKLETCTLPSMDSEKLAFIDEWRIHLKQSAIP
ncbi:hypothetical protein OSB04_022021 [Centaurea solstitialis]|uniref:Uncharacterized protein n=1 Tax=Centaurea solstitialis TaxID=347529 RepID=A0AA38SVK3_9ASTR|nr:hypothetical protein OSB04_022021 [Centaurea solstitialis]